MTIVCLHCNTEMPDISSFCPSCGEPVASEGPSPEIHLVSGDRMIAALVYVLLIPAVIVLRMPSYRNQRFVRFHAWQSVFVSAAAAATALILRLVFAILAHLPLGSLFAWLAIIVASVGWVVLWLVLLVKALQGEWFELPVVGEIAKKRA